MVCGLDVVAWVGETVVRVKRVFESVVIVAFQSAFHLEKYVNNVFYF